MNNEAVFYVGIGIALVTTLLESYSGAWIEDVKCGGVAQFDDFVCKNPHGECVRAVWNHCRLPDFVRYGQF